MKSPDENFIKFGITSKSLKIRLNKYPSSYKINIQYHFSGDPGLVWDIESYVKKSYRKYRYKPKVKFGGSSQECLNISILNQILNDKTVCCN